jgi:hypothetical protein
MERSAALLAYRGQLLSSLLHWPEDESIGKRHDVQPHSKDSRGAASCAGLEQPSNGCGGRVFGLAIPLKSELSFTLLCL